MEKQSNTTMHRRKFVQLGTLAGAAFTVGFYLKAAARGTEAFFATGTEAEAMGIDLTAWVSIDKEGQVVLYNHRSEMGQGSFQSVPQILAEELEVSLHKVRVVFAKGYQGKYGSQITGGSSTIRGSYKQLLKAGATAREMLLEAAAQQWKVAKQDCYAEDGQVIHRPTGKKIPYGELVGAAAKVAVPKEVPLKPRSAYKLIGKPLPRIDNPDKVNGKAIFGMDKTVPGMLYAMVERSPRFHGKVKSYNEAAALAVPGVQKVVKVSMPVFGYTTEGVAVVGSNTWACMQARKVLQVQWDDSGIAMVSTQSLYKQMEADLQLPGNKVKEKGDAAAQLQQAGTHSATYRTPYEAHACMEPLCCVAHWQQDKIEVWGPIQAPDWVQGDLAKRFGLKPEAVDVHMTFLGGGFGRKAFLDYPAEAVTISKAIGAPVKVVWSREDDMTQGPFRPGAMYRLEGRLQDGRIQALRTRMAGQNMNLQNSPNFNKQAANRDMMEGLLEDYLSGIPHYHFADVPTESPVPVMWWRAVYSSTNSFAYESFMDEMAVAAGADPIRFRQQHLTNTRALALLQKLADMSGWQRRKKGDGYGVALAHCFGSYTGHVVKVAKRAEGGLQVEKVWSVIDCGWYVNPDIIRQQVEGSVQMAYGAAVVHELTFANGRAVETNFNTYDMPRLGDISDIDIHIMENDAEAGGVGEPALPPFAPALCNAIYDLTGQRIRSLPFSMAGVG